MVINQWTHDVCWGEPEGVVKLKISTAEFIRICDLATENLEGAYFSRAFVCIRLEVSWCLHACCRPGHAFVDLKNYVDKLTQYFVSQTQSLWKAQWYTLYKAVVTIGSLTKAIQDLDVSKTRMAERLLEPPKYHVSSGPSLLIRTYKHVSNVSYPTHKTSNHKHQPTNINSQTSNIRPQTSKKITTSIIFDHQPPQHVVVIGDEP